MKKWLKNSEFAELCGVSPSAITKAVRQKRLVKSGKKIDVFNRTNAAYIRDKTREQKNPEPPPVETNSDPKETPAKNDTSKQSSNDDGTDISKAEISVLKTIEDIETAKIKNDKERKKLVDRKPLIALFGFLQTVDKQEIVPLAGAFTDACSAAFGEKDKKKIHRMEQRLTSDIYKALAHKKRLIDDYIKENLKADEED